MKGYFAKYIPAVFFFSLVFIFFNAVVSFYNLETLLQNEKLINHTQQVLVKMNTLHLSVKEAESSQRNFLITGEELYRTSFMNTSIDITKEMTDLLTVVQDNPKQVSQVKSLQQLVNRRLSFLRLGIKHYDEDGFESVQNYIRQGNSIRIIGQINASFEKIENVENELLHSRMNESIASANRTYVTILIETLSNIFLLFIIYYLVKRELDYRSTMEKRKDEFISIATHELKTPITSLQVFAQILQRKLETKGDAQAKQYSARITKQVGRLTELINDLLDVSRLQLGKMKFERRPFDINSLVVEVVEGLQQTTETHKILIKGKVKKNVYGDGDRIEQVITNLLTNAIKYSPDSKKIIVSLKQDRRFAAISVQDFGIGISEKHKAHIFERFYRAYGESEKSFPGLGMGLYIAQEIIRRHQGKLSFISKEGKGSTFSFTIPYASTKR